MTPKIFAKATGKQRIYRITYTYNYNIYVHVYPHIHTEFKLSYIFWDEHKIKQQQQKLCQAWPFLSKLSGVGKRLSKQCRLLPLPGFLPGLEGNILMLKTLHILDIVLEPT